MYYPIRTKPGASGYKYTTSTMAGKGVNRRDLPQLLNTDYAQKISNYFIDAAGQLKKRKGLLKLFESAADGTPSLLLKYTSDIYIFGYGNKIKAYTLSTDTVTSIKTDFTTSDPFSGQKYGDYVFVCNGGDRIGRISRTLAYDGQTANFTVGAILTGGTSGATAVILEDSDSGTTGTLTLGTISGVFVDNEAITDDNGSPGAAVANGAVGFTYTATAGPKAKVLYIFKTDAGTRMIAGNITDEDESKVIGSEVDDLTNPPFTGWTVGTGATDAFELRFANGGAVNAINSLGSQVVVFCENGKFAFRVTVIDSAGTPTQDNPTDYYIVDTGGSRAALWTKKGLFYVNEGGIYQLLNSGQTNVPYSANEAVISKFLGNQYFADVSMSNVDIAYDENQEVILITVAKDSNSNNLIIVYDIEAQSFTTITGWNISRFMKDGSTLYGISSILTGSTPALKVWQLFTGNDDDGSNISTEYEQEINVGSLFGRKSMSKQYLQGILSPSSEITISFDIYDINGVRVQNKAQLLWTTSSGDSGDIVGYGDSSYGGSPYGGDVDGDGTIETFSGYSKKINSFQRLIVRFTESSQVPHTINWFSLATKEKALIRRRNLTTL